ALPSPRRLRAARLAADDVATLTGADPELVAAVAAAAGVDPARADAALIGAVEAVAELTGRGLDLRHLRPLFQAARKTADLAALAASAARGPGSAGAERAAAAAQECAEAMVALNAALVRLHSA
ncbi:MAG: hypothetical protein LBD90_05585, partial [Bifidobacteriaceae bacterium]|nr:hypothetical protein [Bifidobacteriaceae bacterium]